MPRHKATLLAIDDEPLNLALLSNLLNPHYRILGVRSGPLALALLEKELPDLILLDVMMPEMDGFTVLVHLKQEPRTADIPVIMVSALGDEVDEELGLSLGAVDYIIKPIKPVVVQARVRTHLELHAAQTRLAQQNTWLEQELARRLDENLLAQDITLCALASLAETRDNDTGNHILRTQAYVEALGRELCKNPAYAPQLRNTALTHLVKAAPLHDIGKIGIHDDILLKPGKLSAEEFEVMKTHTRIGGQAITKAMHKAMAMHGCVEGSKLPESILYLETARQIATHHHEYWDGSGYPDGLAGRDIPLSARIMAVADVFDALTMRRGYKQPWSVADAHAYILKLAGVQFDPNVVAAFEAAHKEFTQIRNRLPD
jgi:putative two-component system response regulator